ncbi:glucosylglycerate hydrolase [Goodfellowiella coeruleoviolacea]|uniref:Alkaline and neutral invertase n=1 Tax=Goodfellowiella coeruleoviolacea TaxID=334858 RepID=A0AAE3GJI2_9PSEU|nr:glycoside hydrolase 100 family protein [Goodfellowiella coeruleoviolacea]MCP2168567.1 Alkaline and neutral invertase [Goodfellowiella coeruleoviolacea]
MPTTHASPAVSPAELAAHAAYVLRANDIGVMTTASPRLYPHLWSWDAAFITTGLAKLSVPRAIVELRTLLAAQWRTGMLPHIVFGPDTEYFPGPDVWRCEVAPTAPAARTSGICQPPVHAIAVAHVLDAGRRAGGADRELAERFVVDSFDRWLAWHRWLAGARDPEGRGLLEIHHGWESGMDNSPRWDDAYARIQPPQPIPVDRRHDLRYVKDPAERPSDTEYQRYLWLIQQMREARYDDDAVRERIDFRMADVFMSAIASAACAVLAELGAEFGRADEAAELNELAQRFRDGVLGSVSATTGLARDQNLRTGAWVDTESIAGFAPLICGADQPTLRRQVELFTGPRWCGHPDLRRALPPSVPPDSPEFQPRSYWRGPQWPVMTWLFWWALRRHGQHAVADRLRAEALDQLGDLSFAEYYQPLTGQALGSSQQSWTAAVALAWLVE